MFSEFKKSINSVVSERVSSPFWGAIIISWFIWNWQIIVFLFFTSEDKLPLKEGSNVQYNKVEYILNNYSDQWHIIWAPLLSTIIILAIVPFVANGAYWLFLRFRQWRISQKNKIEMRQVLTIEQSLQLRKEIKEQSNSFHKLIENKDALILSQENNIKQYANEINEKNKLIDQFRNQIESDSQMISEKNQNIKQQQTEIQNLISKKTDLEDDLQTAQNRILNIESSFKSFQSERKNFESQITNLRNENDNLKSKNSRYSDLQEKLTLQENVGNLVDKVLKQQELSSAFDRLMYAIQNRRGSLSNSDINSAHVAFFEGNDIVTQKTGQYSFTQKGKEFLRQFSEKKIVV